MNGQRSPRKGLSQNRAWPRAPPLPLRSQMANYPPSLNNDRTRIGVAEHPRPARRSLQAEWPLILAQGSISLMEEGILLRSLFWSQPSRDFKFASHPRGILAIHGQL